MAALVVVACCVGVPLIVFGFMAIVNRLNSQKDKKFAEGEQGKTGVSVGGKRS